jgi:hypothetical protein
MENQNETQEKITLKIESAIHGHETQTYTMQEAISRVEVEVTQRGKWLYCDGKYTNVDVADAQGKARLTETLRSAKDITLAGTLLGG